METAPYLLPLLSLPSPALDRTFCDPLLPVTQPVDPYLRSTLYSHLREDLELAEGWLLPELVRIVEEQYIGVHEQYVVPCAYHSGCGTPPERDGGQRGGGNWIRKVGKWGQVVVGELKGAESFGLYSRPTE